MHQDLWLFIIQRPIPIDVLRHIDYVNYNLTSDTLKCQLGSVRVRMRNLRPRDNRETPLRLNLREERHR